MADWLAIWILSRQEVAGAITLFWRCWLTAIAMLMANTLRAAEIGRQKIERCLAIRYFLEGRLPALFCWLWSSSGVLMLVKEQLISIKLQSLPVRQT
ncbi:MAG: hypothetical protein R3E31_15020 [Chloroflexota bacterium]